MNDLKYALEAVLFASERPLNVDQIKQAFSATDRGGSACGGQEPVSAEEIRVLVGELQTEYESQNRGFKIFEIAGGFQLVSDPRFSVYLKRLFQEREKKRLSQASLETLSVIAYRQPVTRADIEFIRGVNVDGAIKTLLEKGLVRIAGRRDVPGRPFVYGTTEAFLEHFGLNALKDLPALAEFTLKDIDEHLLPPDLKTEDRNQMPEAREETPAEKGD